MGSDRTHFDLGQIHFEQRSGLLSGAKSACKLEPKAADVLALLCAESGTVVSRERLLDCCWDGDSGSDESLTQAVAQIRRALEAVGAPREMLTTYPKRGYRLSAPAAARRSAPPKLQIPLWAPLSVLAAACILILAFAPGWPRHAVRHALGLGPPHNQRAYAAGKSH